MGYRDGKISHKGGYHKGKKSNRHHNVYHIRERNRQCQNESIDTGVRSFQNLIIEENITDIASDLHNPIPL